MSNKVIIAKRFSESKRWMTIASSFAVVFGYAWLSLEPLAFFSIGKNFFESLGWFGYIGLVVISIIIAALIEVISVLIYLRKFELTSFSLTLETDGQTFHIKAPNHLRVDNFLDFFFVFVENNERIKDLGILNKYHDPFLCVNFNGTFIQVDSAKTLLNAGILHGTECKIEAVPKRSKFFYNIFGLIANFFYALHCYLVNLVLKLIY